MHGRSVADLVGARGSTRGPTRLGELLAPGWPASGSGGLGDASLFVCERCMMDMDASCLPAAAAAARRPQSCQPDQAMLAGCCASTPGVARWSSASCRSARPAYPPESTILCSGLAIRHASAITSGFCSHICFLPRILSVSGSVFFLNHFAAILC